MLTNYGHLVTMKFTTILIIFQGQMGKIENVPSFRPSLKKSLFPVHRVAIIVASREAAKSTKTDFIVVSNKFNNLLGVAALQHMNLIRGDVKTHRSLPLLAASGCCGAAAFC